MAGEPFWLTTTESPRISARALIISAKRRGGLRLLEGGCLIEGDANSSPELIPLKLKFKNSEIK